MTGGALLTGMAGWLFVGFAVLALLSAIAVVVAKNPVHSALYLLTSFLLVACIFILQQAEFVGAVQILVYAGGIMVLFLFVVMLVNPRTVRTLPTFQHQWDLALVLFPFFLLPFAYILWTDKLPDIPSNPDAFRMVRGHAGRQHRGGGLVALPRLPAAVRGGLGVPARRDDRRGRPRQALAGEDGLMTVTFSERRVDRRRGRPEASA